MEAHRIGPVVVGIDGSANARRALVIAGRHARSLGARLLVVHAVGLTEVIDGQHVPSHDHRDDIERLVDGWCDGLRDDGMADFEIRLIDGAPVDVVLRAARDAEASMIVVGRRGAGGRPELRLGSTAHQIVEHAYHPVLVIPPIGHSAAVVDDG